MPSDELRAKLQLRKEEKQAQRLQQALRGLRCLGYAESVEIPEWVGEKLGEFTKVTSVPASRLPDEDDVPDARVDAWIENFIDESGVTPRFLLKTNMRYFPWLRCEATGRGWVSSVRAHLGGDLCFLSHDKRALVVIFEEEYEYLAFHAVA